MADTLNVEVVDDDASQDSLHEWDSLGYLSIMARIEEEFGIQIRQDNINNFGSISEIVSEIEKCNHQ